MGVQREKKENLVASLAKLDQTVLSSPFPPQTTGTLSALRFVIMSLIRLDSTIKATQMTGENDYSLPLIAQEPRLHLAKFPAGSPKSI